MKTSQFSLGRLLLAVAFVALGLAALMHADALWDLAVLACTAGLLFVSAAIAVIRRGKGRLFWVGFAVGSWGYAIVLLIVFMLGWWTSVRSFPTTRLLMYTYENFVGNAANRLRPPYGEEFVFIGHYLITLLFGCIGAGLAGMLSCRTTANVNERLDGSVSGVGPSSRV